MNTNTDFLLWQPGDIVVRDGTEGEVYAAVLSNDEEKKRIKLALAEFEERVLSYEYLTKANWRFYARPNTEQPSAEGAGQQQTEHI